MTIEIRNATPDDLEAAIDVISTAFLERPDLARVTEQVREVWELDRTWVAVDDGRVCGTFRSWPTEITVPGLRRLPAAAVAAVTVLPTHRRRGILTGLAAAEHAALGERGEAFGLLYASEFPIYGRYGYGPATRIATWTIDTAHTSIAGTRAGAVELVRPDEAVRDEVIGLYDRWRATQVAEIRRRPFTWNTRLGLEEDPWDGPSNTRWKGWVGLHRDAAGALDGFLRYQAESRWDGHLPKNQLVVQDLFGMDEAAEHALWAHLLGVDLVATVKAEGRGVDDRIGYRLANPRAASITDAGDALWVRVFDVPRALEARTYERADTLVLDILDDQAAGGRWRVLLDGSPDGAACAPTDRSPDLTIPVTALGSVYLGAHELADVALRTGADEHTTDALARASALFRTRREPWCSTFF